MVTSCFYLGGPGALPVGAKVLPLEESLQPAFREGHNPFSGDVDHPLVVSGVNPDGWCQTRTADGREFRSIPPWRLRRLFPGAAVTGTQVYRAMRHVGNPHADLVVHAGKLATVGERRIILEWSHGKSHFDTSSFVPGWWDEGWAPSEADAIGQLLRATFWEIEGLIARTRELHHFVDRKRSTRTVHEDARGFSSFRYAP